MRDGESLNKDARRTLRLFQCDFNRSIEEAFSQVLTENDRVRLFFINENRAFTDGRNIVVDPAIGHVFADKEALKRTEDFMKIDNFISSDPWHALRMITRGQNIHESLHILYTDFPGDLFTDKRATSKVRLKTLALVSNIIEDAFIEAVGCSVYDNLELFLQFMRLAVMFSNSPVEGTVARKFSKEISEVKELPTIVEYLEYMVAFLLYPMVNLQDPPESIAMYVADTKQLFLDGSICGNSSERYRYTQQVFDIIEEIIPKSEDDLDDEVLIRMLPGMRTHTGENQNISTFKSKGRSANVTRRLLTDLEGNKLPKRDFSEQMLALSNEYGKDKQSALKIVFTKPTTYVWNGSQFECAAVHKKIEIIETKPRPNFNLMRAYQNIYNKYSINITTYNSRFTQLLKARVPVREEKRLFGSGISSKRLSDVKKRHWYRNTEEFGTPDIAIMLLIDGSGSMEGERKKNAMVSSVILHEVLKKQGIVHAIVEHRAIYGKPTVRHNILVDFMASEEEKLNILSLKADEGTREGLSLYWAERYITTKTSNESRLIIVLSDGVPAHRVEDEGDYLPPVSTKDTANAASKIQKRGTNIIAVALDDGNHESDSCYDNLKSIYTSVVACTDLKRLTGQLLGIISKSMF